MEQVIILVFSAVGGLLGGYFGAYFKKKGENLATKDDIGEITGIVENVKAAITQQSDQFKSELNIAVNKRSRLYEIRLDVVKQIYILAHKVNASMQLLVFAIVPREKSKEEFFKEVDENINVTISEFTNYYISNSIFLTSILDRICDQIINEAKSYFFDIKELEYLKLHGEDDPEALKESILKKGKALKDLRTEFPKRLITMKEEFIKIIDQ